MVAHRDGCTTLSATPRLGAARLHTSQLDTSLFHYDLRSRIPDLPAFLRVDGVADVKTVILATGAKAEGVSPEVAEWAGGVLEAEGKAEVKAGRGGIDPKEAARRRAVMDASAALATTVFNLLLDTDVTVDAFVRRHPELRDRVGAVLAGAKLTSESLNDDGTLYTVKLSLPGAALLAPLRLGQFQTDTDRRMTPEAAELARMNALASARENLRKRIHRLPLRSGKPASTLIEKREGWSEAIDRFCNERPILSLEYTPEGIAKITVGMRTRELPEDLRGWLATGTPARLHAVGGGLPVKKVQPPAANLPAKEAGAVEKGAN